MPDLERPVPYNTEAEEATLGAMLTDEEAITKIAPFLDPSDFYRKRHEWICEALYRLHERGDPADMLTVTDELERTGKLADVGGPAAISELFLRTPSALNAEHYARIVERTSVLRRLIQAAEQVAQLAYTGDEELDELLDKAEEAIFNVTSRPERGDVQAARDVMRRAYERYEDIAAGVRMGLPTGFYDLDRIIGGVRPTDYVVVGARPSIGKTGLGVNVSENVLFDVGEGVLFFNVENDADQIVDRITSSQTGIDLQRLWTGPLNSSDLEKIARVHAMLDEVDLFIDDVSKSPLAMRARAREIVSRHRLGLIVVDYIQLMDGIGENRNHQISYISRNLKNLATELRVPVLALSQLSRQVENRSNKRPVPSDLRDSGSLEQDADKILFIYRDEVYNKDTTRPNVAEIIVGKHRNGPTGVAELRFVKDLAKFSNLERIYDDEIPY